MMINSEFAAYIIGVSCFVMGILSGMVLAYAALEDYYRDLAEDIREDAEFRCLKTIRENYEKEQRTRELLLRELGEELGVDIVYLPSFGYVTLDQADIQIPENIMEDRIGYED